MHITRKFWSPKFCGSYAPLNLNIFRNILLKQLVSATPLKLLNRISWNLVGSKDTICSCAYYQEILWELFANTSVISLTETCTCVHVYIRIYVQESIIMSLFPWKSFSSPIHWFYKNKTPLKSLEHRLSNFLEWGSLPWQYGIVPVN